MNQATWREPPAPGSLAREVELAVLVENAHAAGRRQGNLDQIMEEVPAPRRNSIASMAFRLSASSTAPPAAVDAPVVATGAAAAMAMV